MQPVRRRSWRLGMFVSALAIRLAAGFVTGGLLHPDVNEYDSIARALVAGQGFVYYHIGVPYYAYAPPLDAWLGAASYWLTGSIVPLMVLQCVAGAWLATIAGVLASRLSVSWVAEAAAGALVAVNPGLIAYNATKSHPLTFDALFFALTLLLVFRLAEQRSTGRAVLLGAVVGIGALSRGTIAIFLPMAGLWLLALASRQDRVSVVRQIVVAGIVAAAVLAPWIVRTSLLHHRFIFILTTDSEDFWRGNNPWATGHSYVATGQPVITAIPPEDLADLQSQPDELAQAAWFSTRARAFVRDHPGRFIALTATKFFHFWWFAPQTGVLYSSLWLQLYKVYYAVAIVCAGIGLAAVVRSGSPFASRAVLVMVFLVTLSGLQSLYYVEGRHRWAVEPMLLALSGCGVARVAAAALRPARA